MLLVSASDTLHNARAVLTDFRTDGMRIFERFNKEAGAVGTIGSYRGLVTAARTRMTQLDDQRLRSLVAELDRTVATLEQETGIVGRWPLPAEAS